MALLKLPYRTRHFIKGVLINARSLSTTSKKADSNKMIRLFEEKSHAKLYAQYRPSYPGDMYDAILELMSTSQPNPRRKLAVDVACGSGQNTSPLATHFESVVGTDISDAQVQLAQQNNKHANVTFLCSPAEDLHNFTDQSVDLVSCAQAIHWLDRSAFYEEAQRVLRPGGVVAVIGYGNLVLSNHKGQQLIEKFYKEDLHGYWSEARKHVDNLYRDIKTPFTEKRIYDFNIERVMPLSAFIGYLHSWSAYQKYAKEHPEDRLLEDLGKSLAEVYAEDNEGKKTEIQLHIKWPIVLILGINQLG